MPGSSYRFEETNFLGGKNVHVLGVTCDGVVKTGMMGRDARVDVTDWWKRKKKKGQS